MKNLLVKKCLQAIALFGLFFIFIKPIYAEGVFYFSKHEKDYDDVKVDVEDDFAAVIMGTPLVWLNSFASNALGLTGEGQIIGVADTGISTGNLDKIHPDLKGKIIDVKDYWGDGWSDPTGHGTHILGSMVGTGVSTQNRLRGMAPGAVVYFQAGYDENSNSMRLPNMYELLSDAYNNAGARIHSNSWGIQGGSAVYDYNAHLLDKFVWEHPDMLVLKSAGNFDPFKNNSKSYVTSPGMSKNAIVIGASENLRGIDELSDNPYQVAAFSRRGTLDGRIKPDLVAPGTWILSLADVTNGGEGFSSTNYTYLSGTSMANALATGITAVLRQYFVDIKQIEPSAALVKAALIYGAKDLPNEPRLAQGFGLIDLQASIMSLEDTMTTFFDYVPIKSGDVYSFSIDSDGKTPLKAVLVWSDYPADPYSDSVLVNDIDLKIISPDGRVFWGNNIIKGDKKNNVEVIVINNPIEGKYKIEVIGSNIKKRGQTFSLIYGHIPIIGTVQGVYNNVVSIKTVKNDIYEINADIPARLIINNIIERNIDAGNLPVGAQCYYFPKSNERAEDKVVAIYDAAYSALKSRFYDKIKRINYNYNDIEGHWAEDIILRMSSLGIVAGYPDGSFRPDEPLTRAQLASMLVRLLKVAEVEADEILFYDVDPSAWYSRPINSAFKAGIVAGHSKYLFGPKDLVTREELAVMMARAAGYESKHYFLKNNEADLYEYLNNNYIDTSDISLWAKPLVSVMLKEKILRARDENRIEPKFVVTRAEAVVMLNRLMSFL